MPLDESRIAIVELKVGTLEKSLENMADGIQHLVIAEAKRDEDRNTFTRLFQENKETRELIEKVDMKLDTYIEKEQAEKLENYRGVVRKIVGILALMLASALVGHFFNTHLI
jgi:Na+/H+ antiporter NhaB